MIFGWYFPASRAHDGACRIGQQNDRWTARSKFSCQRLLLIAYNIYSDPTSQKIMIFWNVAAQTIQDLGHTFVIRMYVSSHGELTELGRRVNPLSDFVFRRGHFAELNKQLADASTGSLAVVNGHLHHQWRSHASNY